MTEQQQVYPTWQSVFINLINSSATKWAQGKYIGSHADLKILREWLPQVCYDETKEVYEKTEKKLKDLREQCRQNCHLIETYYIRVERNSSRVLYNDVLTISGEVRRSLERHGYLSREMGAQPKIPETAKIGERQRE